MEKVDQEVLVIGGGIAGMQAALEIAGGGQRVVLAEKAEVLGGHIKDYTCLFPDLSDGTVLVGNKVDQIMADHKITVQLETEVTKLEAIEGGIRADLMHNTATETKEFTAVVIAGGYQNFEASRYGEYGYGRYPGVISGIDFEQNSEEILRRPIETAVFIKCVGARDRSKGMPYCSKICCMYTAKQAKELKQAHPEAKVYIFYMDIRANVKGGEEFVSGIMEQERVRYIRGRVGKVFPVKGRLMVRAEDTLMGVPLEIETDLVVLATAMIPVKEMELLVTQVGGKVDDNGFISAVPFAEGQNPMRIAPGVYYAGACGFPCDVRESLQQGSAAAAGVLSYLQMKGRP